MNSRFWWQPCSFSTPPLSRVCRLSSLTAHPSHDGWGGSIAGWRRKGLDQSGLMNHSSVLLTEMLRDHSAPLKHAHSHAYMNTHTTTTPEAHFHTDSWAIDCGLYVHNCNMRSSKRDFQSHSVESSFAIRLTQSPWCCLHVQPPWACPTSTTSRLETEVRNCCQVGAVRESIYTQKHEDKHTYSTRKIWYSHIVSLLVDVFCLSLQGNDFKGTMWSFLIYKHSYVYIQSFLPNTMCISLRHKNVLDFPPNFQKMFKADFFGYFESYTVYIHVCELAVFFFTSFTGTLLC